MRVAWVGLGKLGSVCAAVLSKHGHDVKGYEPFGTGRLPQYEADTGDLTPVPQADLPTVVGHVADHSGRRSVIFVAVQTPHAPQYGGETELGNLPLRDFEYGYLVQACRDVFAQCAKDPYTSFTVVVVSTVLPGTMSRLIRPMLPANVNLVYNPFFIAMGTTVRDFRDPEFVLVGADRPSDVDELREIYSAVHSKDLEVMSVESAELTKVAYNTFVSMKIVFANTMMEVCHKTGADVDAVSGALSKATERVTSGMYLRGGMGDGGSCHPRDNIAMSWLAERLDLSVDLMGFVSRARELQSAWLAREALSWAAQTGLPIVILGKAYKPGSPLMNGSPALLLRNQLEELAPYAHVDSWDPYVDVDERDGLPQLPRRTYSGAKVFVIGTKHTAFTGFVYPQGSVIIDPHGYIPDVTGCTVVRVGRKG